MSTIGSFEQERHQLIEQLVGKLLNSSYEQRLAVINQIAVTILRSRPLCRRFNSMPLTGIYRAIYLQAKEKLIDYLDRQYQEYNSISANKKSSSKTKSVGLSSAYLYELQTRIFKEVIDDGCLKKMGLAAQKFNLNSELRTYALTELIRAIEFSGRLCRPHKSKFSPALYQMLYEEAIHETLCYICLNINLYDPERGDRKFMNWVNFKLDKSLLKCYEQYNRYAKFEIPSSPSLSRIVQPSAVIDLTEVLRECLIEDSQGVFTSTHIRNRPDANFTKIALAKFSGKSWEQISQQLDIPVATLSSFYNRWCRRFSPLLNTELQQYF